MDLTQIAVWGLALLIGGAIGVKAMRNREKGNPSGGFEKVPVVGRFFWFEEWKPDTPLKKNIIVGKVLTIFYVLLAVWKPYCWIFVAMGLLYHVDYFEEEEC